MEQSKTAEEVFNDFVNIRSVGNEIAGNIIEAMQTYAEQQVKKALALNSELPLTEAWLFKFGFDPVGESEYFKKFKLPNGIYICQAMKVVKNDPFGTISGQFYMGENHTHIPTVHWLQNYVYFNYNGFELTPINS